MSISIGQEISFQDPDVVTIGGFVIGNKAAIDITVSVNDAEGGSTTVNRDGSWNFAVGIGNSDFDNITATVRYRDGSFETSNNILILSDTPLDHQIASEIMESGGVSTATVYNSRGRGLYDLMVVPDGEGSLTDVTGRGGPTIAYTDLSGSLETIDNFRAAGPRHDTLNLSDTGLHTLAQVLHHTTMNGGSATIHIGQDLSVTLTGVTRQQLAEHPHDFVFRGGHTLIG